MKTLLPILQHADSGFPNGSFAFSGGLEGLAASGFLRDAQQLRSHIGQLIRHRWLTFDRLALLRAHIVAADDEQVVAVDEVVEAASLCAPLRDGSCRNGTAMLIAHERLGTPGAAAYRLRIAVGTARGHMPVVQGMLWARLGIGRDEAQAMSLYATVSGLVLAAVRLGLVGALEAQLVMRDVVAECVEACAVPADPDQPLSSFTPLVEIAVTRHEKASTRFFAN